MSGLEKLSLLDNAKSYGENGRSSPLCVLSPNAMTNRALAAPASSPALQISLLVLGQRQLWPLWLWNSIQRNPRDLRT